MHSTRATRTRGGPSSLRSNWPSVASGTTSRSVRAWRHTWQSGCNGRGVGLVAHTQGIQLGIVLATIIVSIYCSHVFGYGARENVVFSLSAFCCVHRYAATCIQAMMRRKWARVQFVKMSVTHSDSTCQTCLHRVRDYMYS